MSPISQERADWISMRLKVVDACVIELHERASYYSSRGEQALVGSMQAFRSERMQLEVELAVLNAAIVRDVEKKRLAAASAAEDE